MVISDAGAALVDGRLAHIDGYEVVAALGRGGMGIVYRVRDPRSGEELALKTVRGATREAITAIRREFRILDGLRIPGVVRVRQSGVVDGLPYYVMDCIAGRSLRACAGFESDSLARTGERSRTPPTELGGVADGASDPPSAPTARASELAFALTVLARLCATLVELHGAGVVHGDLKPENVIVRPDGQPVIVDFARASHFYGRQGRERLDIDAQLLGTAAYMAPEQLDGQVVDARADLYAFGCMLYELMAGRLPFGGTAAEICAGHLYEIPLAVSLIHSDIPPLLERLISRLLEKNPARRPGRASDVLRTLLASGMVGAVDIPFTRQPYVYRPALAGRARELERIEQATASGQEQLLFVRGGSGIGKTRLLLELGARATASGIQVVSGECLPIAATRESASGERGGPLHPFRSFLLGVADRCQSLGTVESERLLGGGGKLLGIIEPALAAVPASASTRVSEPTPGSFTARQLGDALASVLRAVAAGERLLVLLDDLQWGDDVTLTWLKRIFDSDLELAGVSVVAAYRGEELSERHHWLAQARPSQLVSLLELEPSEVERMLSSMLALDACPPELRTWVATRCGGNPLFIAEYLRYSLERGDLSQDPLGHWRVSEATVDSSGSAASSLTELAPDSAIATPASLQEILARRVHRLSSTARSVALAAASLGREGELALLETIAGQELVERALDDLIARDVLRLEARGVYRFCHDRLREQLYESGAPDERRRLHARIADALEPRARDRSDPLLWILLAHHLGRAERHAKSFDHLERATDHFLATGAYADAIDALGRLQQAAARVQALDRAAVSAGRLGSWERRAAVACLHLGRMDDCERHALRALSLLRGGAPRSTPGWGASLLVHLAAQASHFLLPPRVYQKPGQRKALVEVAQAAAVISRASFFSGHTLKMITGSLMAVNAAECADSREDTSRDFASLGYICSLFGSTWLTRRYFAQAREAKPCFDALLLEALYRLGQAQWAAALTALNEAERLASLTGDPQDIETVHTLLGHAEHYGGRFEPAMNRYSRVLASARRRNNRQSESWALSYTARSLIALGFPERGVELCGEALQALEREPDVMSQVSALGILLRGAVDAGQLERAAAPAQTLRQLLTDVRPTAFVMLHGWEGLAEYELTRWRLARSEGSTAGERSARRWALGCVAQLEKAVRIFPFAEPWAWRLRAQALMLLRNAKRAERAFQCSAAAAARLCLPFEEALAHAALARWAGDNGGLVQNLHADRASALFAELGCVRGA
jgi:serine/threonine protein kinase/tetratricopeptide (TPR) repeat protein